MDCEIDTGELDAMKYEMFSGKLSKHAPTLSFISPFCIESLKSCAYFGAHNTNITLVMLKKTM